ncbi:MAG: carboxypeptidase-like regulatory domain-containing protein [Candidatus Krumholzibacteriia bacterium]
MSLRAVPVAMFLCLFLLPPGACQAQPRILRGSISGRVVEHETDKPIRAARVVLVSTNTEGTSRRDGAYRIVVVPAGTHTVKVSCPGYLSQVMENVRIEPEKTTTLDFRLLKARDVREARRAAADRPALDAALAEHLHTIDAPRSSMSWRAGRFGLPGSRADCRGSRFAVKVAVAACPVR